MGQVSKEKRKEKGKKKKYKHSPRAEVRNVGATVSKSSMYEFMFTVSFLASGTMFASATLPTKPSSSLIRGLGPPVKRQYELHLFASPICRLRCCALVRR